MTIRSDLMTTIVEVKKPEECDDYQIIADHPSSIIANLTESEIQQFICEMADV